MVIVRSILKLFFFLLRQLREQAKKLTNTKRNQQIERERQAAALSEMKQQLDDGDGKQIEMKVKITSFHACVRFIYKRPYYVVLRYVYTLRFVGYDTYSGV